MDKMDSKGMSLEEVNIERLKTIFPECVVDGKIDFSMLKLLLGENIASNDDYSFRWVGKNEAIKYSIAPSGGTLIPVKNKSREWEKTNNLYIEGDNLEVLKILQKTYHGKIKMIFIDPPYNTGHDFVYKDNYAKSIEQYLEVTSQSNRANPDTSGRYHTDWLNMIYPRIKLGYELLSEDGLMIISIGEQEVQNLKKICIEIFGENNYIDTYIWESTFRPDNSSKINRRNAEYCLCMAKNIDNVTSLTGIIKNRLGLPSLTKSSMKRQVLKFPANVVVTYLPDGTYKAGERESYTLLDDVYVKNGKITNEFSLEGNVIWSQSKVDEELKNGTEIIIKNDSFVPYTKKVGDSITAPTKLIPNEVVGDVLAANSEMSKLFPDKVFSYPKPVSLIRYLIRYVDATEYTVLDFFSGSSTTAQAVFELNAYEHKNINFIMVQLPENLEENYLTASDKEKPVLLNAIKLCDSLKHDKTICSVAEERILRAGNRIFDDLSEKKKAAGLLSSDVKDPSTLDFGFKVFKLDSTCIKPWDPTVKYDESSIFGLEDVIKEDRTNLDVAYEIMLKYGVFNMPLEEIQVNGKTVYSVGCGYMIISLNKEITPEDVEAIAKLQPKAVVFKESGFVDDNAKINADYTFKRLGIDNVKCI